MTVGEQTRQQKILRLLRTFASDPIGVSRALPGLMRQRHGTDQQYEVDEAWEEHLHEMLGAPWPCPQGPASMSSWPSIGALLAGQGLGFGRYTYGIFSDADSSLCRAVWCTVVHTRPEAVDRDRRRARRYEPDRARGAELRTTAATCGAWTCPIRSITGCMSRPARPSPMRAAPAGPTWKARASSGFRRWSPRSAASGCSSTTACTRPGTWCSRCSRRRRRWRPAGSCWWTT